MRTFQSAPQPGGARMIVRADTSVEGSVSGGCVEGALWKLVQEGVTERAPWLQRYGISDESAFPVGLTCSGTLDVFVEPRSSTQFLNFGRKSYLNALWRVLSIWKWAIRMTAVPEGSPPYVVVMVGVMFASRTDQYSCGTTGWWVAGALAMGTTVHLPHRRCSALASLHSRLRDRSDSTQW